MSRTGLYSHLLPPPSTADLQAMKVAYAEGEILDRVFKDESGNTLDGHTLQEIGPDAPTKIVRGLSPGQKEAFAFRRNLARRHLTREQKNELRPKLRATALKLKSEDHHVWTDERIAKELGCVDRTQVTKLLGRKTTNVPEHNGCDGFSRFDARLKVPTAGRELIVERVRSGESQAQVAADFGISQQHVSKIVGAANMCRMPLAT